MLHREPAEQPDPDHRRVVWQPLAGSALPGRPACRGNTGRRRTCHAGVPAGDDRHGGFTSQAGPRVNVLWLPSPSNALPPSSCQRARRHGGWLSSPDVKRPPGARARDQDPGRPSGTDGEERHVAMTVPRARSARLSAAIAARRATAFRAPRRTVHLTERARPMWAVVAGAGRPPEPTWEARRLAGRRDLPGEARRLAGRRLVFRGVGGVNGYGGNGTKHWPRLSAYSRFVIAGASVMSQDVEDTANPYQGRGVFGSGPGRVPVRSGSVSGRSWLLRTNLATRDGQVGGR